MCSVFKSVGNKSWKAIINGWSPHTVSDEEGFVVFAQPGKTIIMKKMGLLLVTLVLSILLQLC